MVAFGFTTVLALVASLSSSAAFAPKSFGVRPLTVCDSRNLKKIILSGVVVSSSSISVKDFSYTLEI